MIKKPLVILGSARQDSDTRMVVSDIFEDIPIDLIDLLDVNIHDYSYDAKYPDNDGFGQVIMELLNHQTIVFATPVYWYAMSGLMKSFFDRLTDTVTVKKELGRRLKGKSVFFIAVGTDPVLPMGFEVPFSLTARYFDMYFLGGIYFLSNEVSVPTRQNSELVDFIDKVKATLV